mmetsp:Transcript_20347/g.56657  ORF Transcript_20347/g.56657 Transcript_20347/m.56657 type:complete len:222 (-) Transcript_20347:192-857(-)
MGRSRMLETRRTLALAKDLRLLGDSTYSPACTTAILVYVDRKFCTSGPSDRSSCFLVSVTICLRMGPMMGRPLTMLPNTSILWKNSKMPSYRMRLKRLLIASLERNARTASESYPSIEPTAFSTESVDPSPSSCAMDRSSAFNLASIFSQLMATRASLSSISESDDSSSARMDLASSRGSNESSGSDFAQSTTCRSSASLLVSSPSEDAWRQRSCLGWLTR